MNNNVKKLSTWMPLLTGCVLAAGILIGYIAGGRNGGVATYKAGTANGKLAEIMHYIENNYVDEVSTDSLLESLMPQLLSSLDPHSTYIPAEDFAAVNESLEGSFSGIGITFNMLTDTITVDEVISGGPSEKVGIMPGDRIVTVNDSVVAGKSLSNEKVISMLRGPRDTKVKVGVKRSSSPKLLDFEITRGQIPISSIDAAYMIDTSTGYIKVNQFGRTTFDEFINEAYRLQDEGARKLMVDLRGNGGGYMEMAILMANEFLNAGDPIVSTRGRSSYDAQDAEADGSGNLKDMEIAVLTDEFSASASEILAGAVQDNDRGLIVGRRTFGKGLVQNQFMLSDSSAIRLTIARYYTPSGRCIQKSYLPGGIEAYEADILNRLDHGEFYSSDSVKIDKSIEFHTASGRPVYGGGGIMPDIFVPRDTTGVTSYYLNVFDKGLLHRFAFDFNDTHRQNLSQASNVDQLFKRLPADDALLKAFAEYAERQGVPQRWYYINISSSLIVNQLKALIARNALGTSAYYEVANRRDPTVQRALDALRMGAARFPITPSRPADRNN